jgi:hypothetical protein
MLAIKAMYACNPNIWITLVVQEKFGDKEWMKAYLPDEILARVELLTVPSTRFRFFENEVGIHLTERLRPLAEPLNLWDVVISAAFKSNPAIKAATEQGLAMGKSRTLPVVAWSLWTPTNAKNTWPNSYVFGDNDRLASMLGAFASDRIVFESQSVKKEHLASFREYLKPEQAMKLVRGSEVISNGADLSKTEAHFWDGERGLVGFWSDYHESPRCDYILEAMVDAYKAGKLAELNLVFMHVGKNPPEIMEEYKSFDGINVHGFLPHAEYVDLMEQSDIVMTSLDGGTYGVRFVEAMACGMYPVFHKHMANMLLPPDYEFAFEDTRTEAQVSLFRAIDALQEQGPEMIRKMDAWVREHHDGNKTMRRLYRVVEQEVAAHRENMRGGSFYEMAEAALAGIDEISHDDACEKLKEQSEKGHDYRRNGIIPPGVVRWTILELGFEDVGDELPLYRRIQ